MEAWLKAAVDYIPDWLGYQMRQSGQPGCVIAIAHKGRVVLEKAFGVADLSTGEKLTPRHRLRAASHSKSFTAAGVMKLREAGALRLDDPAGRYVDGLHPTVAATTLTQLLSHSAGMIRDGVHGDQFLDRRPFANERELRAALAEPLTIEPSSRFKYSNHAFGLVGLVMEAVTGEPYREWIAREIVAPSGLRETTPDAPAPKGAPMARGHTRKVPLGQRLVVPGDNPTHAIGAAGGFVSTAADLARFFASLDPAAKRSVLSPASRREMIRKQWHNPHGSIRGHYGLGIMQGQAGAWEWFGHAGGFQSCISRTAVLPGRDICVSILVNAVDGPAWGWSDAVIHILQTFEKRGAPSARTRDWAGRWWSLWRTVDLVPMRDHVLVDDPGLAVPFSDASEIAVTGSDTGTIRFAPGIANFGEDANLVRGKDGRVREVWIAGTKYVPERRLASELKRRYGG